MARFEFKLPDIGEGVAEGEIVSWLIKPGDVVREDQPMVEVMTDKATVTIAAPRAGRVVETIGATGDVVKVHAVLAVFEIDDARPAGASAPAPAQGTNGTTASSRNGSARPSAPAATAVGDLREDLPGMGGPAGSRGPSAAAAPLAPSAASGRGAASSVASRPPAGPDVADGYFTEKPLATPATRKLARDLGIDLRRVRPTGPGGRVTSDDVRALERRPRAPTARPAGDGAAGAAAAEEIILPPAPPAAPVSPAPSGVDRRIPLRGTRKRIFEGMARSKRTLAHATFVEECDVTELKRIRERLKPAAQRSGVALTYLPFIVKAVVAALKKHPSLNATFDEAANEIVEKGEYNIGIAAATEAGLVVPVVKHADRLSLLGIAREIDRLAQDARSGKSRLDDLQGGTFTITSLGQQSGLFAMPVIHYPESGILGIHRIKRRPVVRGEQIVIGDVMLLSLSFDHRLIDGDVAAAFVYEIIGVLETPETLLLEAV